MNSSAEQQPARALLDAAFLALREEAPTHHAALRDVIDGLAINLRVRAEHFAPAVVGDTVATAEPSAKPDVVVATSLLTARRLLEGECTLVEAVEHGELDVRGNPDALDAASRAFTWFLHGLVRAPSGPSLLRDLADYVATSGEGP